MSQGEYLATRPTLSDHQSQDLQLDNTGALITATDGGAVASGDPDAGNPIKVGGVYNGTPPAYNDGERGDLQLDARGNTFAVLRVQNNGLPMSGANAADSAAAAYVLSAGNWIYNEATFDRARGNTEGVALASAARTASVSSADITNHNARGVDIIIDATVDDAAASVTFTVQGKDPVSDKYYTILVSAAIAAVSTTVLRIGPGLTASANTVANYNLPRTWRVSAVAADTDALTYSVGYSLIV